MPRFALEEIEDYYTYYVLILGIPEETFWSHDLRFISRVAADKSAYDAWLNYAQRKEVERNGRK
jgi:hypothetical protein